MKKFIIDPFENETLTNEVSTGFSLRYEFFMFRIRLASRLRLNWYLIKIRFDNLKYKFELYKNEFLHKSRIFLFQEIQFRLLPKSPAKAEHCFGIFNPCDEPKRNPDYISASGSMYWRTEKGMYRSSNHWGQVRSSFYVLKGKESQCGFCKWENMYPITEYTISEETSKEYDIPLFPEYRIGKQNIATEFNDLELCTMKPNITHILDNHPNHHSDCVCIIDGLFYNHIKHINLVY
jgi:hypothetical protein